eukprot:TRINITY_DN5216_c0_g1_i1.p1 TRINITY_DN5216_c0_g1~~TRINITY_DN5216_c0_g1_i1.p1  ORF type:complete len:330 (-),score=54.71 TRINITY_DN5216_c0_g1_i1:63-1052(-)
MSDTKDKLLKEDLSNIGNTPLIYIKSLSEATGCSIFGKAEYMNPGGSVKDRTARGLVLDAENDGRLKKGGTIVEGTAGNTGIALAMIARARGYKCIMYLPDNQSQEKIDILKSLGSEVHTVPVVPFNNPKHYYHTAKSTAEQIEGGFFTDQFENLSNYNAHYTTTGPEIWKETGGKIDAFISACGTGGTLGGTSCFLKEQSNNSVQTYLVDCQGSSLYSYVTTGELKSDGKKSITSGIGIARITANFAKSRIDGAFQVDDRECVEMVHYISKNENILLGSSSGVNLVGAVKLARKLGPGKTIVTMLCDAGTKYLSQLYNNAFLESWSLG